MLIDFGNIPLSVLPNFKGGEKQMETNMYLDELNRIMYSRLVPGASIGEHVHDTSSEMIFILSGKGTAVTDGVKEICTVGKCHYCPKGSTHTLINDGDEDLVFFAVVPQQ
ncbi:MAG: cupin domain-containing protein [Clostridia bacterium]|nr:cupin domain-containing protein [Clostridia bacterium]